MLGRVALALLFLPAAGAFAAEAPALELVATIPMPDVRGRIDHFAADPKGRRLFVAALGNDTVEVVDIEAGRSSTLRPFDEPQGVGYVADSSRIFVANGQGARVDVLDAASLKVLDTIKDLDDADNVRVDAAARAVLVGYGGGGLAIMDWSTGHITGRIALPAHPESFQLERRGSRVFINVPRAHKIVIADRAKKEIVGEWSLPLAAGNYAMALDEDGRRLFVAARLPATLLVYDIDAGKLVAKLPVGGDVDDMFFDAERKRIYVICGEGRIDVMRQESPDRYGLEASIQTAPRARTGIFVPEDRALYVAAPANGNQPARILAYRIRQVANARTSR